ncbi:aldo/keto reductase [Stutzerimonas stutzeri]|jgi:aryl-alcohol dehydrogenase-like predicted oxidoreductase|uniref:aldo/keto reductase n=1 Tax=Stutzerimonas stutzeri TaxID=316 RepID=UPI00035DB71C|nr:MULTISPECIES: aldo/keto reductase [Pseudomonadaceae]MDM9652807.1 aldo/keto reductase [Pseudomonas wenzhouensis]
MQYRQLGKSGLLVSELCFGTMPFGAKGYWEVVGGLDQAAAQRLVDIAIDGGINFFDTADVYSHGQSEEILGKTLKGKRDQVVLATKVRGRMSANINDVGLSRHHIIQSCENSLKRLGTDYIDLYIVHSFDFMTPLEETLSALDHLVRQGKVRYLGCSNYFAWQLMKALSISERKHLEKFVSLQAYYSLVARDVEYELVPLCEDQGLGLTPWSPLAGGFLTGKYPRDNPKAQEGRRSREEQNFLQLDEDRAYAILDEVQRIARERDVSPAQVSLNYLLRKPAVSSVLIGATKPEQLEDNLNTAAWSLTPDEVARLDAVSEPPRMYPKWMLDFTRLDRDDPQIML